jgi:histidine triad (HIT) family protein
MAYDPNNIFAKILRGELPAHRVYEDDEVFSFMDIFPQARGHTLVIPKVDAENFFDLPPEWASKLILKTQMIAKAVHDVVEPDGVFIAQFNGASAGQTVFHIHYHIIPRWKGVAMPGHGNTAKADDAELAALAQEIGAKV